MRRWYEALRGRSPVSPLRPCVPPARTPQHGNESVPPGIRKESRSWTGLRFRRLLAAWSRATTREILSRFGVKPLPGTGSPRTEERMRRGETSEHGTQFDHVPLASTRPGGNGSTVPPTIRRGSPRRSHTGAAGLNHSRLIAQRAGSPETGNHAANVGRDVEPAACAV